MLSTKLTLETAISDSPLFRASLQQYEDDVEEVSRWLDASSKSLRSSLETATTLNEGVRSLVSVVSRTNNIKEFDLEKSNLTLKTLTESFHDSYTCSNKLLKDLSSKLLFPINQLLMEDIKDLKESKRSFEKMSEKHELALIRYNQQSKMKEASVLREEAFQLFEIKKQYLHQSLDYVTLINKFRCALDNVMVEKMLSALYGCLEYYQTAYEIFLSLKPHMDELKSVLSERQNLARKSVQRMEVSRKMSEDEAKLSIMPDAPLTSTGKEKQGYLFKKKQSKTIVPVWKRVYAKIENGYFSYSSLGKQRGTVIQSGDTHVLLCEIRISEAQDRRFCFEVYSTKRTYLLQAETEDELRAWVETFENAKNDALLSSQSSLVNAEFESDLRNRGWLKGPSSSDALSTGATSITGSSTASDKDKEKKRVGQSTEDLRSKSPEAPPNSSTETMTTSSDGKSSSLYSDPILAKQNEELHACLRSLPSTDHVVAVIPCSLQKEVALQGHLYMTQHRFCFYSNIFGRVTSLSLDYKDVTSIQRFEYTFYSSIKIDVSDVQYSFKTFLMDDTKILQVFNIIKNDSRLSKPDGFPELLKVVSQATKKDSAPTSATSSPSSSKPSDDLPKRASSTSAVQVSPDNATDELLKGLPSDFSWPSEEVSCGCTEHLERIEVNSIYPFPAVWLFEALFGDGEKATLSQLLYKKRNLSNIQCGSWQSEDGAEKKEIKYYMPINNPLVKTNPTPCTESIRLSKKTDYLCYVVDISSRTPEVPYGETFETMTRYCVNYVTKSSCRLTLSVSINFMRSTIMKNLIRNSAIKGFGDYAKLLNATLTEKGRGREALMPGMKVELEGPEAKRNEEEELLKRQKRDEQLIYPWKLWLQNPMTIILVFTLIIFVIIHWRRRAGWQERLSLDRRYETPLVMMTQTLPASLRREEWLEEWHALSNETSWLGKVFGSDDARFEDFQRFVRNVIQSKSDGRRRWYVRAHERLYEGLENLRQEMTLMRVLLLDGYVTMKETYGELIVEMYVTWMTDQLFECYGKEEGLLEKAPPLSKWNRRGSDDDHASSSCHELEEKVRVMTHEMSRQAS